MASANSVIPGDDLVELANSYYSLVVEAESPPPTQLAALGARAQELAERLRRLSLQPSPLRKVLEGATLSLRAYAVEVASPAATSHRLRQLYAALGTQYEALLASLRARKLVSTSRLEHVKPRNLWRNLFHVANGVGGVLAYELVLSKWAAIAAASVVLASFISLDVLRRTAPAWNERLVSRIFGKISRPSEAHRVPSATWYIAALLIGVAFLPKHAIILAVLVLAFSDPVASLVGKAWGRVKLYRGKSVVGSAAFLGTASLVGTLYLHFYIGLPLSSSIYVAAIVGATGTVVELFSHRLDDNFTIPLACGIVAALLL